MSNRLLDWSGASSLLWLLALMHVCLITNLSAHASLGYAIPIQVLDGCTPDISPLLQFDFYEPVYYKMDESSYPSDSTEKLGRFVGISEDVGHALTYKILTDDCKKVIHHSVVCSAMDPVQLNNQVLPTQDDDPHPHLRSRLDNPSIVDGSASRDGEMQPMTMALVNPEDLVGHTFLVPQDNGQTHRARIVERVEDHEYSVDQNPEHLQFKCSMNDDKYEDLLSYRQVLDYIEKDADNPIVWKFKRIVAHEGPLDSNSPSYKGSSYNVRIEWENGEITDEPLTILAAGDPVTCAIYA